MKKYTIGKNKININSIDKVCRLCLYERRLSKTKDIYQVKVKLMIEFCTSIRISKGDGLPSRICSSCYQTVTRFFAFKRKIESNEKILKKHCSRIESKLDILDIALNEAEIIEKKSVKVNIICEEISAGHSENVPLVDPFVIDDFKDEFSIEISSQKSHENGTNTNSNLEMQEILDYYNQNVSILSDDEREIQLKKDFSDQVKDNISTHSRERKERTPEIINKIVKEGNSNCDKDIKIEDLQTSIIVGFPAPIPPVEYSKNEITNSILPEEPPPLIPLKPVVDDSILSNIIKSTPNLSLECSNCEKTFDTVTLLKNHKLECIPSNSLVCNICKKEFKERKKLIGHLKGHMISKDYGCKICGKRYPNPSTFQIHMRGHTGERPFKCTVCSKGFTRWAGVVSHMQTHEDHRPFKCETCDKSFKTLSNLERHKVLHSGILPFCCNYCGKTFSQSDNLQLHIRTYHTNERPYLCSQCGKGFVSSNRLNRHMWIHTGEKPFRCNLCSKAYSNSSDLKNHERSMHGNGNSEKPFACNLCDMHFFHPCRLSKHLKTHQRPFACGYCNKTYSTSILLDKHMAGKHPNSKPFEEEIVPL